MTDERLDTRYASALSLGWKPGMVGKDDLTLRSPDGRTFVTITRWSRRDPRAFVDAAVMASRIGEP